MVKILDRRVGKHSVERVCYVLNNLLQLVFVKYGVILLVLVKYLVIFHADPCNKYRMAYFQVWVMRSYNSRVFIYSRGKAERLSETREL